MRRDALHRVCTIPPHKPYGNLDRKASVMMALMETWGPALIFLGKYQHMDGVKHDGTLKYLSLCKEYIKILFTGFHYLCCMVFRQTDERLSSVISAAGTRSQRIFRTTKS